MKIKASQIKPGMVIAIDRGDNYEDICLVLAKKGLVQVEYLHLDLIDAYDAAWGSIDGEVKVKVLKGKKRKAVIQEVKKETFKHLHDIQNVIDMINLIESMESL